MFYFKVNDNGTLQSGSKKWSEDCIRSTQLVLKEDNIQYLYYFQNPDVKGMYQPNLFAINEQIISRLKAIERVWRDAELILTDIDINKLEDNNNDSTLTRQYRQTLRDYPQQGDFPYGTRPIKGI